MTKITGCSLPPDNQAHLSLNDAHVYRSGKVDATRPRRYEGFSDGQHILSRMYVNARAEKMKLEQRKVVRVIRPVYDIPKSPFHLFETNSDYHKNVATMTPVTMEPLVLYR